MNEQKMFCWQCQETAGNKGCTVCGVCGKTADVAALQDDELPLPKVVGLHDHPRGRIRLPRHSRSTDKTNLRKRAKNYLSCQLKTGRGIQLATEVMDNAPSQNWFSSRAIQ